MACEKLLEYLDEHGVRYEQIKHPQAYSAQETADRARIPGREFAKTVMIKLDGNMAMAVLPAPEKVNFTLLQQSAGAETISLATEPDFHEMFPDCDLGAMPPFGNIYGLDVYVSGSMSDAERIAFPAGTHTELLCISYADFERVVQPRVARFTFLQQTELEAEA